MESTSFSREVSPALPDLDLGQVDGDLEGFLLDMPGPLGPLGNKPLEAGGASLPLLQRRVEVQTASLAEDRVQTAALSLLGIRLKFEGRELPSCKKRDASALKREPSLDDALDSLTGAMAFAETGDYFEEGTVYPKTPHRKYTQERRADGLYYFVPKEKEEGSSKRRK